MNHWNTLIAAAAAVGICSIGSLSAQTEGAKSGAASEHAGHGEAKAVEKAIAVIHPTQNNKVAGTVTFTKEADGVRVVAQLTGLTPGKHGFHIHEFGDCSAPDASSAGGHFNPGGTPHGGPEAEKHHSGDMGNIEADASGNAKLDQVFKGMSLDGAHSILGRGVIVHEKTDDLKSQPTGDAGGRIGCGVIGIAKK